jgi:hypothetical protein
MAAPVLEIRNGSLYVMLPNQKTNLFTPHMLKIQVILLNGKEFFHAQSNIKFLAEF